MVGWAVSTGVGWGRTYARLEPCPEGSPETKAEDLAAEDGDLERDVITVGADGGSRSAWGGFFLPGWLF